MTYTVPPGRYSDVNSAFVQAYIDAAIAGVVDLAPETLNSLNELAAAINDDPAFYATVASQVAELNTDVTALNTALGIAENDSDVGTFSSPTLPDSTTLRAVLEAFAGAYDTTKSNLEAADSALSGRIDTLEADPTTATALAAVQADVDQNELDSDTADLALSGRLDTLEADPTTKTYVDSQIASDMWLFADQAAFPDAATNHGRVVHSHADGAIFYAHGGMWHKVENEAEAEAARLLLSNRLDTLETDPTTQTYVDGINTALDTRLDVLEADPTTQTLLDAETTARSDADTALSGRLDVLEADPTTATAVAAVQSDVDQNEADADAAIALKLDTANPAATGDLTVDTQARLEFDGNLTKLHNDLRSTRIDIGNNITVYPAAAGGRFEIEGGLYIRLSDLEEHNNDTDAANAGIVVGGVYYDGNGHLKIRRS